MYIVYFKIECLVFKTSKVWYYVSYCIQTQHITLYLYKYEVSITCGALECTYLPIRHMIAIRGERGMYTFKEKKTFCSQYVGLAVVCTQMFSNKTTTFVNVHLQ